MRNAWYLQHLCKVKMHYCKPVQTWVAEGGGGLVMSMASSGGFSQLDLPPELMESLTES